MKIYVKERKTKNITNENVEGMKFDVVLNHSCRLKNEGGKVKTYNLHLATIEGRAILKEEPQWICNSIYYDFKFPDWYFENKKESYYIVDDLESSINHLKKELIEKVDARNKSLNVDTTYFKDHIKLQIILEGVKNLVGTIPEEQLTTIKNELLAPLKTIAPAPEEKPNNNKKVKSEEEIIKLLLEVEKLKKEGLTTKEAYEKMNIPERTYYGYKKKYKNRLSSSNFSSDTKI